MCVCVCVYVWGGSNCVSKCDSSDMGRTLIDFEGVLELDETVGSLRYHVETFNVTKEVSLNNCDKD